MLDDSIIIAGSKKSTGGREASQFVYKQPVSAFFLFIKCSKTAKIVKIRTGAIGLVLSRAFRNQQGALWAITEFWVSTVKESSLYIMARPYWSVTRAAMENMSPGAVVTEPPADDRTGNPPPHSLGSRLEFHRALPRRPKHGFGKVPPGPPPPTREGKWSP